MQLSKLYTDGWSS